MAINSAAAKTAAPFWQGCITINANWPYCSGLAGYSLDTRLGNNASSLPGLFFQGPMVSGSSGGGESDPQVAAATATFWRNFGAYFNESLNTMPTVAQNSTYAASFRSMYECPGYSNYHRRYLYSIWCILLVMSSYQGCSTWGGGGGGGAQATTDAAKKASPPQAVPLCRKTCKDYADTTIQTLRNSTQCTNATLASSAIDAVAALCDSAVFNGDATNCISGDEIEPGNCGYISQSRGNMSSSCTPFIGKRASSSAKVVQSGNTGQSALKTTLFVIGILGAALLLAVGILFCLRRRRRNRESRQWGSQQLALGGTMGASGAGAGNKLSVIDGTFRAGKSSEPWDNSARLGALDAAAGGAAGSRASSVAGASRRSTGTGGAMRQVDAMHRRVSAGAICTVVREYVPTLADELEIMTGDRVRVEEVYDDGWAAGTSVSTGASGVFPLTHVARVEEQGGGSGRVVHENVDVGGARKFARSTYVRDSDVR